MGIILSWIIVSLYLGSEGYILKYSCIIQKTNFGETGLYKEDTVRGYMDIRYLFLHVTSYLCIITSNTSFHRDGRVCDLPTPWRRLSFFLVTGTLLLLRCASVTCSGRWSRTTEHVFHITIPLHNAKHRVSPPPPPPLHSWFINGHVINCDQWEEESYWKHLSFFFPPIQTFPFLWSASYEEGKLWTVGSHPPNMKEGSMS